MSERLERLERENRELREAVAPVPGIGEAPPPERLEVPDREGPAPTGSAPTGSAPVQTLRRLVGRLLGRG